ncbi:MAG: AraC family transcriptional regulator [Tannerellaceae bacterium]|jgi:AraC-like DNA-binding protein|nr:AraC family transcriptional regulator [Tannerellaceae bacterium]
MLKRKDGFSGERALVLPPTVVHDMEKDAYSSHLHITDIGYYPKAYSHFRERNEPINQFVFIYCMEGGGWFKSGTHEYSVTENQYFILPAGVPHSYGSDENDPWTIYWIHFKGKLASLFAENQPRPIDIRPGLHSRISDRIALFEEILRTLEMGYSRENILYACTVFHHYLGTLHYIQQYRDVKKDESKKSDIVTAAIHYMRENLEKKLSLGEIAEHTGYSTSYFTTMFNKRTGYAPLAYFNQLKIQQACKLLDSTDMKINQICYKIGIEDTYYFSRLFSKTMGMSPREYKKMKKG